MRIIKAKSLGLCKGGKDSIDGVKALAASGKKVFVYGQLLHNPRVISELEKQGIKFIEPLPNAKVNGCLVIRAHGVSDAVLEQLKQNNEVVDLTCPKVRAIQKLTKRYQKEGYHIIYLGKPGHPEADATIGNLKKFTLITRLDELKHVPDGKLILVAQSTASLDEFERVSEHVKKLNPTAKIVNTICSSTVERQRGAQEVAGKVQLMIVLGGKESSNTKELFELCKKTTETIWVERPKDIELHLETVRKAQCVGITAGASTPKEEILKLIKIISSPIINRIGEERFMVQSDTDGKEFYEVDLAMPFCECRGFYYNKKECKHIRLARDAKGGK